MPLSEAESQARRTQRTSEYGILYVLIRSEAILDGKLATNICMCVVFKMMEELVWNTTNKDDAVICLWRNRHSPDIGVL